MKKSTKSQKRPGEKNRKSNRNELKLERREKGKGKRGISGGAQQCCYKKKFKEDKGSGWVEEREYRQVGEGRTNGVKAGVCRRTSRANKKKTKKEGKGKKTLETHQKKRKSDPKIAKKKVVFAKIGSAPTEKGSKRGTDTKA